MDDLTKAYYEEKFANHFRGTNGDSFQALFSRVMGLAHPEDFMACRPWGNIGDRKNDGYLKSERTLFQVYAPNELAQTETIRKIEEDFAGALPHWREHFEKWISARLQNSAPNSR